jgi:DNA-binding NarL/FixJ family response regulator
MVQNPSPKTFRRSISPIRTLLVTMREASVRQLMSPQAPLEGHQSVGAATTSQEALGLCGRTRPDVLLLDLREPRAGGSLSFLSTIHERWPQVQLIAVSGPAGQSDLQDLSDAGGIRVLVEAETTRTLAELIAPHFASPRPPLADQCLPPSPEARPRWELTSRERQALGWALAGQDNHEIAERLAVNPLTARLHIQNALGKIRAGATQTQAQGRWNSEPSARPVGEHARPFGAARQEAVATPA